MNKKKINDLFASMIEDIEYISHITYLIKNQK